MRIRPWPIVILAVVHVLAPIANILYSSWLRNAGLRYYLITTFGRGDWLGSALYLLGFPVAGIAIYKTNRWSYPIFLLIMGAMMVFNFETWREFPQYFGLGSLLLSYFVNLAVVSYFLIPAVRNVYFNPRLRWWESKPRYDVEIPAKIRMGEVERNGVVQNVSEGGAYLRSDAILLNGNEIEMSFSFEGREFRILGKVVHARSAEPAGFGIQFSHSAQTAKEMKELVRELKAAGAHERIGNVSLKDEFKSWFVTAISTGQGLIPQTGKRGSQN